MQKRLKFNPKSNHNIKQQEIKTIKPLDKYIFYFTGGTKKHFYEGITVELNDEMNSHECNLKLQEILRKKKVDILNKQLNLYLAGGIPFSAGLLGDFYCTKKLKKKIYGILTRLIPDSILNKSVYEICNVSDLDHKLLISPFCDSSNRGLSDMACLLSYLNHDGLNGNQLLRACASVICFPPMIISLNKIIERNNVIGLDIVTVSSSFFAFFKFHLSSFSIPDKKVLEYTLQMCNLISNIENIPLNIPILEINDKFELSSDFKHFSPYFWKADLNEENFDILDFNINDFENVLNSFEKSQLFKPIAPLFIRFYFDCSILRGKNHEYLYLMKSPLKNLNNQNMIEIINPITGLVEMKDIELFAKEECNNEKTIIEPKQVEQIIMINLDESKSMLQKFSENDFQFITAAIQYLTTFVNSNYGYKIPCIQGLVSFNNKIKVRCQLSPFVEDFENGLKNIKLESKPKLLDSLLFSLSMISEFKKNQNDKDLFHNAISRILLISSGEDINSDSKVEFVVKELIKNKIIVDTIILNNNNNDNYNYKMLSAISHATSGFTFRPESFKDGLSLFEKDCFLNIEERNLSFGPLIPRDRSTMIKRLKPEHFTEEFMKKAIENAEINKNITNKNFITYFGLFHIITPLRACEKNGGFEIIHSRKRRILKEIHQAACLNDPDMNINIIRSCLDRWRVFIKGPEGTPYENKWWYLFIAFPELYPNQAPCIKFCSVPYHLNISSEGHICHNILNKNYLPSLHVIDILQEIKELLLLPSLDTPVRIDAYELFLNSREKYDQMAKNSTIENAKDDQNQFFKCSYDIIDADPQFTIDPIIQCPPYKISQISGKPIKEKNLYMASSGVYYDKNELKQLLTSNKNPVCVITGKSLTENIEDIGDYDEI